MNRWENCIVSVYKIEGVVQVLPRWVKEQHRALYKYEVDTIYRDFRTKKVHSSRLPLALD